VKTFKCLGCHRQRPANPKVKNQKYCGRPECQQARKRAWQRQKMFIDPDYKENQRHAQKQWQENNPDYWNEYRKRHQNPRPSATVHQDAKMDTFPPHSNLISGRYKIIPDGPSNVKMDAIQAIIIPLSTSCLDAKKDPIANSNDST